MQLSALPALSPPPRHQSEEEAEGRAAQGWSLEARKEKLGESFTSGLVSQGHRHNQDQGDSTKNLKQVGPRSPGPAQAPRFLHPPNLSQRPCARRRWEQEPPRARGMTLGHQGLS